MYVVGFKSIYGIRVAWVYCAAGTTVGIHDGPNIDAAVGNRRIDQRLPVVKSISHFRVQVERDNGSNPYNTESDSISFHISPVQAKREAYRSSERTR